ncbi:MAG: hypothetical protein QM602_12250 [Microbacterium sp.]
MSTPDQPNTPGLTRKQLREIRMTGVTPVMEPDAAAPAVAVADAPVPASPWEPDPTPSAVHLPRAAAPVAASTPPTPDAQVDLGVVPLTRRQAREQERIRTASVPVITPELAAQAATESPWAPPVSAATDGVDVAEAVEEQVEDVAEAAEAVEAPGAVETGESAVVEAEVVDRETSAEEPVEEESAEAESVEGESADAEDAVESEADAEDAVESEADADEQDRPVLLPGFGAALLAGGEEPAPVASSFDDLLTRSPSSGGSVATPNALILSQPPTSPLTQPVAATGEVLITGSLALPEGLGSQGHAPGVADGREVDAVLIDGELPPTSSPTPIAASAAISTVKGTGEIIRPPAPEKGNTLMLALAITAGVLAVALVGVLITALVTGVFS